MDKDTLIQKLEAEVKKKDELLQIKDEELNSLRNQVKMYSSSKYIKGREFVKKIIRGIKSLIHKVSGEAKGASDVNAQYQVWCQNNSISAQDISFQKKNSKRLKYRPKFSVIMPVYADTEEFLIQSIESVLSQTYDNWELCIADDKSPEPKIKKLLQKYESSDERIKTVYREENGNISQASNSCLELATGDFVVLLDNDDLIPQNAFYELATFINQNSDANFIYSDEDKIDQDGERVDPFFKPDWSPDMLLSTNYICHLSCIKKELVDRVGKFRTGFEGAQDYDLFLRVTEKTDKIYHIPKVLYHWRQAPGSTADEYSNKEYAQKASIRALEDAMERRNVNATVSGGRSPGLFWVRREVKGAPLVSIVIPTKEMFEYLERCVESILKRTSYSNFEIVLVDTGSKDGRVLNYYKSLKEKQNIRVYNFVKERFNFAEANNFGVDESKGEYVLLLNNDTEVVTSMWLESMLGLAQRTDVGAVGAKLLYPDGKIQHAGIHLGLKGVANHVSYKVPDSEFQGFPVPNSKDIIRNFSAVTAACLMIKREKYLEVGGLDSKFRVAFNDVDFCLKLMEKGYYNVYTPYAKLYHYESVSFGQPGGDERSKSEFKKEIHMMWEKWNTLLQNDPFYNPNLSLDSLSYGLKI